MIASVTAGWWSVYPAKGREEEEEEEKEREVVRRYIGQTSRKNLTERDVGEEVVGDVVVRDLHTEIFSAHASLLRWRIE